MLVGEDLVGKYLVGFVGKDTVGEDLVGKVGEPIEDSVGGDLVNVGGHIVLRVRVRSGHWYEIMALYYVKSFLTEISASRQDRRVLQKSKIIRIKFLSIWGMLQTSIYV